MSVGGERELRSLGRGRELLSYSRCVRGGGVKVRRRVVLVLLEVEVGVEAKPGEPRRGDGQRRGREARLSSRGVLAVVRVELVWVGEAMLMLRRGGKKNSS